MRPLGSILSTLKKIIIMREREGDGVKSGERVKSSTFTLGKKQKMSKVEKKFRNDHINIFRNMLTNRRNS